MGTKARLVTQRPKNHARMMTVTHHHPCTARQPRCQKSLIITERGVVGVRFDICFTHHIQTMLVTQIKESRVIGVMARAHCIAVVSLHRQHISEHVVAGHCFATLWVMIVAIDATNRDALTIHPHFASFNANAPEPGDERSEFSLSDASLNQLDNQSIPMWVFSRPRTHIG